MNAFHASVRTPLALQLLRGVLAALALALPLAHPAFGAGTNILVKYESRLMDKAPPAVGALGPEVSKSVAWQLLKEFPCSTVDDYGLIREHIRRTMRAYMLDDTGRHDGSLEFLGRDYRYTVVVKAMPHGSGAFLSIRGVNHRRLVVDAQVSGAVGSIGDAEPLIRKFIKQMAKMEICPYTGLMSLAIESSRSKTSEDARAVYCNQADMRYRKTESLSAKSRQDWKLQKTGRIDTTGGSIKVSTTEHIESIEEDGCAFCTPQRQAAQISRTETTTTAKFDSLSDVTRIPGHDNHDATVVIQFTDDDKFFITLKATTKKSTRTTDTTRRTEGACSNTPQEHKTTSVQTDVALEEPRLGPFAGSPLDKQLKGKFEIPLNDPLAGETGTKKIEFDLRRR